MPAKFVILDSSEYAEYFCRVLKDEYSPITLNDRTKSILESRGIKTIGVLDYLDFDELKEINERAFSACGSLISELDNENRSVYRELFGSENIRLGDAAIGYLLKRFTIGAVRLISGLDAISKRHGMDELVYLHDGSPRVICGTKKERGFFFNDDITWQVLQNWRCADRPALRRIKAGRESVSLGLMRNSTSGFSDFVRKVKAFLAPLKRILSLPRRKRRVLAAGKKTLLFMSPLYDFELVLLSPGLGADYNIFEWSADDRPGASVTATASSGLSFKAERFRDEVFFKNFAFKSLAMPLIKAFYDKKLQDLLRYWHDTQALVSAHDVAVVFWGNSPHRYPHGIVKEFSRMKGVPICGMQHGGSSGSNDLGRSMFETDLDHCDYYFSYGFEREDLELGKDVATPSIIPVGSTAIREVSGRCAAAGAGRKKVDILFPLSLAVGEFYYENEFSNPRLFEFQKRIMDALAGRHGKSILLKFPPGTHRSNPIGIYVEKNYPGRFAVADNVSFTTCLEEFEAGAILIEEQSTPLNEALVTDSNIIVYNNPRWAGLTRRAHSMLSKRAVVCDSEEGFLGAVSACLAGRTEKRDVANREFLEKYCTYRGNPTENIENAIRAMAAGKTDVKRREFAHAG